MGNRVRTLLIVIVTSVWALNFTAPIFVKDYQPAPELNVAFMAVLGVLTSTYRSGGDKDKGNEDNQSKPDRKEIDR